MAIGKTAAATAPAPARTPGRTAAPAKTQSRTASPTPAPAAVSSGLVSLNPDTFNIGGLIDDIDVEITDALAVEWDYNGQAPLSPALAVEYTDVNGAAHIQYYGAGKLEDWRAHESGEGFVPVSGKTGFNNSSNVAMLLDSLVKAGFPKDQLTGNVKVLIGTKCHVLQQVTERKGLIRSGPNANKQTSVLLVTKIHQLPMSGGGAGVGAGATVHAAQGKANGAATTPVNAQQPVPAQAADSGAVDLDSTIQEALLTALGENPVIEKKDIVKVVFQHYTNTGKTPQERNKAVIRAGQQDFLKGLADLGISYDGSQIALAQ